MSKLSILVKKILFGEALIARIPSKLNGEIQIFEDIFGVKRLKVGELTQSGGEMDRIMKLAFNEAFRVRGREINHILMFGLGAGTWIAKARKYWPDCQITIIEFDQTMVDLSKKYFHLESYGDIEIINQDAFEWLLGPAATGHSGKRSASNGECTQNPACYFEALRRVDSGQALRQTQGIARMTETYKNSLSAYDLIVVDLYLGIDFPTQQTQTTLFTSQIKHLMATGGLAVVNRLNWGKHKEKTDRFQAFFESQFKTVWTKKTLSNRLIFCSNETY